MGISDWLSGGSDLTAGWLRDPSLRLSFDFAKGRLCGVTLGEAAERLSFLGRAEDGKAAKQGELHYFTLGLSVGVSAGMIEDFGVWWQDYLEAGYAPYAGDVTLEGRELGLGPGSPESQLLSAFGEPYWRDVDESETILFYELKDRWGRFTERQVEMDEQGRLKAILAISEPILADEKQRLAYHVDKTWPPSSTRLATIGNARERGR